MNLFVSTILRILMQIIGNWLAAYGIDASSLMDSNFIQAGTGIIIVVAASLWGLRTTQVLSKRGVTKVRLRPHPKNQDRRDPDDRRVSNPSQKGDTQ